MTTKPTQFAPTATAKPTVSAPTMAPKIEQTVKSEQIKPATEAPTVSIPPEGSTTGPTTTISAPKISTSVAPPPPHNQQQAQISDTFPTPDPVATTRKEANDGAPLNWAEIEAKYKRDIEILTESAEMATIDKEIAEEKLDNCERELQTIKDQLAEASLQIEMMKREHQMDQPVGAGSSESTVTVLQLQKVEEQNELLKQAIVKLRDISTKDKQALEDLQIEHEEVQEKLLDLEEREQKYLEQIKVFQEQIDISHSAQEMVEKLTQQKTALEDALKEKDEELDTMEKLRDLNDQIIENARINEIELTGELDKLRSEYSALTIKRRDMEDYLSDQERSLSKLKEENRVLVEQIARLRDQFKEGESIEQQKHQIENVAYKLNFSESKMAEKEAEIARYRRNLAEVEEQMNNLSLITKEQSAKIDELKIQNDTQTSEISELQRALKKKMEEVSELEIRRDMAEKKLQSLQKDSETKVANLTRIIETMKGVEVQHEEEIQRWMDDYEEIEKDRRQLREQLNKSNRSLERSMQAGNNSMAHDASLASLGISFQTAASSPGDHTHHHHHHSQHHQSQREQQHQQADPNISLNLQSSSRSTSICSTAGPVRQMSFGPDMDDSILISKLKDLSTAFDRVNRKNYELEMELAFRELDNKIPPYNGSQVSQYYDIDRARGIQTEIQKLKREIRAAMINQKICPRSRQITSVLRSERFNNSKLALKFQALENEATALMSSSTLARSRPKMPLLQSTPVK